MKDEPLDFWSRLILILWGVPDAQEPYTDIRQVVYQLSKTPEIQLILADHELSDTDARIVESGFVEIE